MNDTVLLTGATGFLGMELLVRLLERTDHEVIVLVRTREGGTPAERMAEVYAQLYEEVPARFVDRVTAFAGDISTGGLGLSVEDRNEILQRATGVVHCAASIAFDLPMPAAMNTNAAGTARILSLALELAELGRLRRIVHVSTAYVSGCQAGVFLERDLGLGQRFRNSYEASKASAEWVIRCSPLDLPLVVARPSIVVGDSRCGWTPAFNVIYWPLRAFCRGLIDTIPASPGGILDIVPIDYVADGILALYERDEVDGTVHLVAAESAITNAELGELASRRFALSPPTFGADEVPRVPDAATYLPYFHVEASFDDLRAREILGVEGIHAPPLDQYFSPIVDYAQQAKWGKQPVVRELVHRAARQPRPDTPQERPNGDVLPRSQAG